MHASRDSLFSFNGVVSASCHDGGTPDLFYLLLLHHVPSCDGAAMFVANSLWAGGVFRWFWTIK